MLALSIAGQAQTGGETEHVRLRTDLVLLDVEVLNKKTGELIGNMSKEDFVVHEDGVRQHIEHFQRHHLKSLRKRLSMVLAVSPADISTINSVEMIKQAAQYTVEEMWQEDEVALMVFVERTRILQEFTTDKKLILDKIPLVSDRKDLGGLQLIDEVIYQAAVYLERASNPLNRRLILVVMTGNLPNWRVFKGHSSKEALRAVHRSNALVYGVIVRTPQPLGWQVTKGWWKVNPILIGTHMLIRGGSLKKYAEATGGEVLELKPGEVATLLPGAIGRIQARYTLGYVPSDRKQDGKFRKITVRVAPWVEKLNEKVVIRARRGYIAAP